MKFRDHLNEQLKDPEFKKEYDALEGEHMERVGEIIDRFGAHERLYKQQKNKQLLQNKQRFQTRRNRPV